MKYLNLTEKNSNFFIKDKLLYNVNSTLPIADLSDGKYLDENEKTSKMKEFVEFYQSGARVTIECAGERCIQFYGNDGKKLAETYCHRGQNKDNVSILPIDLGVFSSEYIGKKVVYRFVDYKNIRMFVDHNFSNVYKNVERHVERSGQKREILSRTEKFRQAISNIRGKEVQEKGA